MAPLTYIFDQGAYNQITSHCVKHMSHNVFGLLIGTVDKDTVHVETAVPLCHRPMVPFTFSMAMNMVESALPSSHAVVGTYFISLKGTHQPLPGGYSALAAKVKTNAPGNSGHSFTVDAEKLSEAEPALHAQGLTVSQIELPDTVMRKALDSIRDKSYLTVYDFDEFFHDPSMDCLAGLKYIKQ